MAEAATKVSLRGQRRRERLATLKAARPQGGVRVVPTDEKYRRLKHPNGVGFRAEGSIEWPNDRFTRRRIAEGVIKVEEAKVQQPKPAAPRKAERTESY